MNMGALVLKNASEYIQEKETGQSLNHFLFQQARRSSYHQLSAGHGDGHLLQT